MNVKGSVWINGKMKWNNTLFKIMANYVNKICLVANIFKSIINKKKHAALP